MLDAKKFFKETEQIFVIFLYEERNKLYIPFIGIDGKMEFFFSQPLAENAVKKLKEGLKVNTYIKCISGNDHIRNFIRYCHDNDLNKFRFNNGTTEMQDLSVTDIYPEIDDCKDLNLVDYLNRSVRGKFLKSKAYEKNILELSDEDKQSALGEKFQQAMFTNRFNAFREMYNGIFYVLNFSKMPAGADYYTKAALDKAEEALKSDNAVKKGLDSSSLYHKDTNRAETIKKDFELFYVNHPGKLDKSQGFMCVFTDYKDALAGMHGLIEAGAKGGSVLAATSAEIIEKAQDFAGIVMDMNTVNYMIVKKDFELIDKCGHYKEPIVVKINRKESK